jgi:hypothetical protein
MIERMGMFLSLEGNGPSGNAETRQQFRGIRRNHSRGWAQRNMKRPSYALRASEGWGHRSTDAKVDVH